MKFATAALVLVAAGCGGAQSTVLGVAFLDLPQPAVQLHTLGVDTASATALDGTGVVWTMSSSAVMHDNTPGYVKLRVATAQQIQNVNAAVAGLPAPSSSCNSAGRTIEQASGTTWRVCSDSNANPVPPYDAAVAAFNDLRH